MFFDRGLMTQVKPTTVAIEVAIIATPESIAICVLLKSVGMKFDGHDDSRSATGAIQERRLSRRRMAARLT
jgi:hypothetical protein